MVGKYTEQAGRYFTMVVGTEGRQAFHQGCCAHISPTARAAYISQPPELLTYAVATKYNFPIIEGGGVVFNQWSPFDPINRPVNKCGGE